MLETIVFIIYHRLKLILVYLVSVHDMLMVEQLKCVGALRDLERLKVIRVSQMLKNGFQSFKTQNILEIDLFLIHLKSAQ